MAYIAGMVSEHEVESIALEVIGQNGEAAFSYATHRADELLNSGVLKAAQTWRRVAAAIERMQQSERGAA